ncbi:hypothetical protein ACTHQF_04805 [Pedobacter sp. SAFR-022]|jgi:hypothetical protein|uniref:hypothetical protein n=1 Tax=Pedobacter sp. SAFR-022 TaxID=3436861 RepID=UPI003F7F96F3
MSFVFAPKKIPPMLRSLMAPCSMNPDALIPIPQQAVENSFKDGKVTLKQNPGY